MKRTGNPSTKTKQNELRNQHKRGVASFCSFLLLFASLDRASLLQLSKISNRPSELSQSLHSPIWPQANSRARLDFKASPLVLCTSEGNAIGIRDQRNGNL